MPKRSDDQMESYWGDLAGEPLLRPREYGEPHRTFRAWAVALILGMLAFAFMAGLYLLSTKPAKAEPVTVPQPCIAVAKHYGLIAPEKMERSEIEYHMKSAQVVAIGFIVSAVRRCRAALKVELKK